ncbi:MAG: sodium/solute symporter [bacterium]
MLLLDWIILCSYLCGMLLLAAYVGRKQANSTDYFLAGRGMSSGSLAASTMATQCSTNSLLGAPAFVGFTLGGGLLWLQYELAVPLAMAALIWLIVPARQAKVTSIYEILEQRLGVASRRLASAAFLLFRGVATGVTIYGVALILSAILGLSFAWSVVLLMAITIFYDVLGGLRAVVLSDLIQLALLVTAVWVSLFLLADATSWSAFFADRTDTLVNDWGFSGSDYGFWPMLIGGFFLYMAYYGCDQSQAQRVLAADSDAGSQRVLMLNGLLRFPLVLSYCLLGMGLAAFASAHPEFIDSLPQNTAGQPNYNMVFPTYVMDYFAPGFVGLVMVGLIAAAMSSVDSAINSLSAATMEDFVKPLKKLSEQQTLTCSRITTLLWGLFCIGFSFQVEQIAPTVLEAINKIGSMANGPLLAMFVVALLLKGIGQKAALSGFVVGLVANVLVALFVPQVSWLWWNVVGLVASLLTTLMIQILQGLKVSRAVYIYPPRGVTVMSLVFMALCILIFCIFLDQLNG